MAVVELVQAVQKHRHPPPSPPPQRVAQVPAQLVEPGGARRQCTGGVPPGPRRDRLQLPADAAKQAQRRRCCRGRAQETHYHSPPPRLCTLHRRAGHDVGLPGTRPAVDHKGAAAAVLNKALYPGQGGSGRGSGHEEEAAGAGEVEVEAALVDERVRLHGQPVLRPVQRVEQRAAAPVQQPSEVCGVSRV